MFKKGYKIFGKANNNKIALISHGKMLHKCLKIYNKEPEKFVCIDIFRSKPFPDSMPKTLSSCKGIVVVDAQSPSGNLSSCIFEGFSNQNYFPKIVSNSLPEKYVFENGGREYLLNKFGLSEDNILNSVKDVKD